MKNLFLFILLVFAVKIQGQNVGINTPSPETSLDIKGALKLTPEVVTVGSATVNIPQNYTHVQLVGSAFSPFTILVDNPKKGQLLILNNLTGQNGLLSGINIPKYVTTCIYTGDEWLPINQASAGGSSTDAWNLAGNTAITETDFLGTTDASALNFKTDNTQRMQIGKSGQVGIGADYADNTKLFVNANKEENGIFSNITVPFSSGSNFESFAVKGINKSTIFGHKFGGYFESSGFHGSNNGDNIGVKAVADNSGFQNIALYATTVSTSPANLAGFFDKGHVKINNNLAIGRHPTSITHFEILKAANKYAAFIDMPVIGKDNNIYIGKNTTGTDIIGMEINMLNTPTTRALEVYGHTKLQGTVGINTTVVPTNYQLAVNGKIIATELRVQNRLAWPDYVFEKDYSLPKLADIQSFIAKNKHLPNVPSAAEVANDGIIVGEMQATLLRKIEELTLYILEQQKQIDELKNTVETLKK